MELHQHTSPQCCNHHHRHHHLSHCHLDPPQAVQQVFKGTTTNCSDQTWTTASHLDTCNLAFCSPRSLAFDNPTKDIDIIDIGHGHPHQSPQTRLNPFSSSFWTSSKSCPSFLKTSNLAHKKGVDTLNRAACALIKSKSKGH